MSAVNAVEQTAVIMKPAPCHDAWLTVWTPSTQTHRLYITDSVRALRCKALVFVRMMDGALVVSLTTRAITDCDHRKQFAFGSERLQTGTVDGFCDVVDGCCLSGCLAFLVVVCPSLAVIKSVTAVCVFFVCLFFLKSKWKEMVVFRFQLLT